MKKLITGLLLLATLLPLSAAELPVELVFNADQEAYIRRYKEIAIREMERTGVPASIKLAQGILESGSGKSFLARRAQNHFGIKCGSNWNGNKVFREDDDYDENGRIVKSCFRGYRNADASFVAHSEFLRDPKKSFRYGFLFRLDPRDYRGWAQGLRRAGYATNPRYPELLIGLIERYNLDQYDSPSIVEDPIDIIDIERPIQEEITGILRTNDVSYFVSQAPVSIKDIARQVDLSVNRLIDYNEEVNSSDQTVSAGERVFLQKKRKSFRGREKYHTVEAGEDLYDIAQRYGLRISNLAKRNRLTENADPATGQKIKLRGSRVKEAPLLEGMRDPDDPGPGAIDLPTDDDGRIDFDDPVEEEPRPNPVPPPPPTSTPSTGYPPVANPGNPSGNPTPQPPSQPVITPEQPVVTPPPSAPTTNPSVPSAGYHTVARGETLYGISRRYSLTVDQLKRLNGLSNNLISIGQQLRVR